MSLFFFSLFGLHLSFLRNGSTSKPFWLWNFFALLQIVYSELSRKSPFYIEKLIKHENLSDAMTTREDASTNKSNANWKYVTRSLNEMLSIELNWIVMRITFHPSPQFNFVLVWPEMVCKCKLIWTDRGKVLNVLQLLTRKPIVSHMD